MGLGLGSGLGLAVALVVALVVALLVTQHMVCGHRGGDRRVMLEVHDGCSDGQRASAVDMPVVVRGKEGAWWADEMRLAVGGANGSKRVGWNRTMGRSHTSHPTPHTHCLRGVSGCMFQEHADIGGAPC